MSGSISNFSEIVDLGDTLWYENNTKYAFSAKKANGNITAYLRNGNTPETEEYDSDTLHVECIYSQVLGSVKRDGTFFLHGHSGNGIMNNDGDASAATVPMSNVLNFCIDYSYGTSNCIAVLTKSGAVYAGGRASTIGSVTEFAKTWYLEGHVSEISDRLSGSPQPEYIDNYGNLVTHNLTTAGVALTAGSSLTPKKGGQWRTFAYDLTYRDLVAVDKYQASSHMYLDSKGDLYCVSTASYKTGGVSTSVSGVPFLSASNVRSFASCSTHGIICKEDGTVWTSGYNNRGMLGLGNTTTKTTWTQTNLTDVVQVSCGANHSFALKNDGTVWGCGYNNTGMLGQNNTTQSTSFIQVPDLTEVVKVLCCDTNVFFLKRDGTVWACGANANSSGRVQGHTTATVKTPTQISPTGVIVDNVRSNNTCSILQVRDGSRYVTGTNTNGMMATNNTTNYTAYTLFHGTSYSAAVPVANVGIAVSGTIAIDMDGVIRCAGNYQTVPNGANTATNTNYYQYFKAFGPVHTPKMSYAYSYLRSMCQDVYNALDDSVKAVMVTVPKYTKNDKLGETGVESEVTVTEDYVFIPSVYEIMGATSNLIDTSENTKCARYSYFTTPTNFANGAAYSITRSLSVYGVLGGTNIYMNAGTPQAVVTDFTGYTKTFKPCFAIG